MGANLHRQTTPRSSRRKPGSRIVGKHIAVFLGPRFRGDERRLWKILETKT
jgi:hypothetical protein